MQSLGALVLKYRQCSSEEELNNKISGIFSHYINKREENLLDAISTTSAISLDLLQIHSDPLVEKAFHLQYPNLDINNLSNYSHDELSGILSGVKGKYFELLVLNKLNSGHQVGDIILSHGQHAELAASSTQSGWDIKILDNHNHVVDYLQAKATNSLGYIKEALANHPDINVVTTHELSSHLNDVAHNAFASNISNNAIQSHVADNIGHLSDNLGDKFLDHFNPVIPLAIITLHEGKKYFVGEKTLTQCLNGIKKRGTVSSVAVAAAAFFHAIDLGVVSIPVSLLTRFQFLKYDNHKLLQNLIEKQINFINPLIEKY